MVKQRSSLVLWNVIKGAILYFAAGGMGRLSNSVPWLQTLIKMQVGVHCELFDDQRPHHN